MKSGILRFLRLLLPWVSRWYYAASELPTWKKGLYPPGHYYSPIVSNSHLPLPLPIDYHQLLAGIDLREADQLKLLNLLKAFYNESILPVHHTHGRRYYLANQYFSYSDGLFLMMMMQLLKPKRIIEVGSGFSSALMLDVNEKFFNNSIELIFVEPYPQERLDLLIRSFDRCSVRKEFVQEVDLDLFKELCEGDVLFIDSSHVSKFNSDVNYLLFRVIPTLNPGVIVHFHDIFFPFEYPLEWVQQGRSWNEAYLLRAFLQYNSDFEILLFTSFVEGRYRDWFEMNMPACLTPHETIEIGGVKKLMSTTGQSIYLRKK